MANNAQTQEWSSGFTFLLAAIAGSVGLGNIWRFPYVAGENGGGAFVIIYLIAVVVIAIPILIAELAIGRRGHHNPVDAMIAVTDEAKAGRTWHLAGWVGLLTGFAITTFYCVIAGWTLDYLWTSLTSPLLDQSPEGIAASFEELLTSPVRMIVWQGLFILLCCLVLVRGLKDGIEAAVKVLLPALFLLLVGLVAYAALTSATGFTQAARYLFAPDFSALTANSILVAVGQAFFSIGVGMGLMMAYGAYLPRDVSIPHTAVIISLADTFVAVLAGLAVFPFVFQYGLDAGEGPGLVFVTLPVAFSAMTGGWMVSVVFFALLAVAALTSVIALLQAAIAFLEDRRKMSQKRATVIVGFTAWILGISSALSFNILKDFYPLGLFDLFAGKTTFDSIDFLTSNIMMPLAAILMALFFAWRMPRSAVIEELRPDHPALFWIWRIFAGVIAPVGIAAIMISALI
jgi:NSS family neurotransmitter:Na+ symporter